MASSSEPFHFPLVSSAFVEDYGNKFLFFLLSIDCQVDIGVAQTDRYTSYKHSLADQQTSTV